jgi:deoxycytidine triphosphate deaminase
MFLLPGKDAASHIEGILHAKYQVHGFSVHLTVKKIFAADPAGRLDFGGSEYAPAGRVEIAPHALRPEDSYRWWELDKDTYFVECNESISLESDQLALIEPEDRLLRAGAWHAPLSVRGRVGPIELLLTVGVLQLRVKENARIARVRLFRIEDTAKRIKPRSNGASSKPRRAKRK